MPSLLVPVPAAIAVCNAAVPVTTAAVVASYTLFAAVKPETVNALAVMRAVVLLAC